MAKSRRFHFESEQWLPYSVETVFAFFARPENLPKLMPEWQKPRIEDTDIVAAPATTGGVLAERVPAAGDGTRFTLTFRPVPLSPVRMSWVVLIEDFLLNERFCDLQVKGPFRYWRQCHSVRAERERGVGAPGTTLRDEVEYELPLPGGLSEAANWLGAKPQIAALFAYRHKRTLELLPIFAKRLKT